MNILFFIIAGTLVLIAFAFVLPPLWRKSSAELSRVAADQDQRNILIAQHRLAELKEQKQSGAISQAQYDEQFEELEQSLSDDLDIKNHAVESKSQGNWMFYVVAVAIPLLAASLYLTLGNVQAISHSKELASANPKTPSPDDIIKMVAGLAERMKSKPDDAQGWIMLGRSYKYLGQYPKAVEAFANAYRLLGDQPEIMLQYAEAIAYVSANNLTGKPSELITKALALEPENLNALWLGGLLKAQQNDPKAAVELWQKLEALLPPGSEEKKQIQDAMAKMQNSPSENVKKSEIPQSTKSFRDAKIEVEVRLDPKLQKIVQPGDTVFIYAQALIGPKMPIAIVRKQVSDLPITVTLDDSMAMMPERKLSNFNNIKLLARISKSGAAMTQPGDLLGVIDELALENVNNRQIIVINTQVN